jgi:hypothetical protein
LGAFYLYLNGKRVSDNVMDPPQTSYSRRVAYVSYDVTDMMQAGTNVMGAVLGNVKWGYGDVWCNVGLDIAWHGLACCIMLAQAMWCLVLLCHTS